MVLLSGYHDSRLRVLSPPFFYRFILLNPLIIDYIPTILTTQTKNKQIKKLHVLVILSSVLLIIEDLY